MYFGLIKLIFKYSFRYYPRKEYVNIAENSNFVNPTTINPLVGEFVQRPFLGIL